MARSGETFAKRQREKARQEKQAEKAQKRAQRKQQGDAEPAQPAAELEITHDEDGIPQGFDFHDFR